MPCPGSGTEPEMFAASREVFMSFVGHDHGHDSDILGSRIGLDITRTNAMKRMRTVISSTAIMAGGQDDRSNQCATVLYPKRGRAQTLPKQNVTTVISFSAILCHSSAILSRWY